MAKDKPLQPDDFPVNVKNDEIVKSDGKPIAKVCDPQTAQELADRLNEDENRREEDRWSA